MSRWLRYRSFTVNPEARGPQGKSRVPRKLLLVLGWLSTTESSIGCVPYATQNSPRLHNIYPPCHAGPTFASYPSEVDHLVTAGDPTSHTAESIPQPTGLRAQSAPPGVANNPEPLADLLLPDPRCYAEVRELVKREAETAAEQPAWGQRPEHTCISGARQSAGAREPNSGCVGSLSW